jgi:pantoate ligase/cytidylate kinase
MGALHLGHLSLIKRAIAETDVVVVSIFVNPLQFGANEDLDQYPRQLEADCQLCEQLGVNLVFAPSVSELYGQTPTTQVIPPESMTAVLCGKTRPGHFTGVATVVTKLVHIVQPHIAYFGEKDGQQLAIIRRLVADLNLPVQIRGCAIVRELSGLAYSSRNQYLSAEEKEQAVVLSRSLNLAKIGFRAGEREAKKLITIVQQELASVAQVQVEYVELVDPQTLATLAEVEQHGLLAIACRLGNTRLIDNVLLRTRQPIIAIDGPAGAGKSSVTRLVASALGLMYLDTGAMYRAVTWLVMHSGIAVEDQVAIAELVSQVQIELQPGETAQSPVQVMINGEDVSQAIRTPEVTAKVSAIAAQPAVRQELVKQQQILGQKGGIVAEGRDIGTHVFPDAELKIFLTASVQERAKRRLQDWQNQRQETVDLSQIEQDIAQRDYIDSHRQLAPLQQAVDAIVLNTDGLTIEEVTNTIFNYYRQQV